MQLAPSMRSPPECAWRATREQMVCPNPAVRCNIGAAVITHSAIPVLQVGPEATSSTTPSPTTGPPTTTPVTVIELCEPGQSGPNCLACSKDKQSCQDKCQASISCSSHGRCRGRNGSCICYFDAMTVENRNRELGELGLPAATILEPPIIVYAPIEQMKTSSSSQAPTTYQGDDCSAPIAPAACDGEFAGPECMAYSFGVGCSQPCTVNSSSKHGRCRGWTGECECFEGYQGDDCSEPSAPPVLKITISLALSMDGFTPSVQESVLGAISAAAGVDPTKAPGIQRAALTVALRRNACQQPMPATRLDLTARRGERRRGGRTRGGAGCACGADAAAGGAPPVLLLLVAVVVLGAAGQRFLYGVGP